MSDVLSSMIASAKRRLASGASGDQYFGNVIYLANYTSGITDVMGHSVSIGGNASVSNGELVLDGDGDYTTTTPSADFDLAGHIWTLEGFIKSTRSGSLESFLSIEGTTSNWNGSDRIQFMLERQSNGTIRANHGDSAGNWTTESTTEAIPNNIKTHFAASWDGTYLYLAVNGVVQQFSTSFQSISAINQKVVVGGGQVYPPWVDFQGSIGAIRITKGVARYKENFVPPLDPFPTQYDKIDPYFSDVVFLSNYTSNTSDSRGHAITQFGTPTIINGELVLNGTTDYLSTPYTLEMAPLSSNFCIEFFYTPDETPTYEMCFMNTFEVLVGGFYIGTQFQAPFNRLRFVGTASSGTEFSSPDGAFVAGVKKHYAIWRYNNLWYMAIDGVIVASAGLSDITLSSRQLTIGAYDGGVVPLKGKFDSIRYTVGSSRYTNSNFPIPPSTFQVPSVYDPHFSKVVFISNFEGNAKDIKGNQTALVGNANVSGGSLNVDGDGDRLQWGRTIRFDFGSSDEFCIEAFVESFARSTSVGLIALTGFNGGISFYTHSDGSIAYAVDGQFEVSRSAAGVHPLNTKQHLALWRYNGRVRAAVDGQIVINVPDTYGFTGSSTCSVGGSQGASTLTINGKVYAARIGRSSRYGETNFTPPTDPFMEL